MRPDEEIRRDVEDELRWEPSLDARDIGVAAKDGVVTLTGYVSSYAEKSDAESAAKRVAGVAALANDLEVRLPKMARRPDPDIAHESVTVLRAQVGDVATHIRPIVKDGWITLEGAVDWNYQREAAETAVRHLAGVRGLTNSLRLKSVFVATDIHRQIEDAFRRSAELDAQQITIETQDGTLILRGVVRSWAERKEAERIAWSAPGIAKIDNRIAVAT